MLDASWSIFLIASVAIIATPGQDMVLVMSRSVAQGSLAGVVTAAGVSCGLLMHTLLATVGVGAIVQTSDWLFLSMKIVGALYLIYLGVLLLRTSSAELALTGSGERSIGRLFIDGAVSNIANPKIAIFYFAFLPQFVMPQAHNPTLVIFALGAAFALLTFLMKGPIGYFAGRLSRWLRDNPDTLLGVHKVSGFVLILLGVRLWFSERP
jgi:threonine/homoserine/homoserine lactone efflux protein